MTFRVISDFKQRQEDVVEHVLKAVNDLVTFIHITEKIVTLQSKLEPTFATNHSVVHSV